MTTELDPAAERVEALREFCDRQGWQFATSVATATEPANVVGILLHGTHGTHLRVTSTDSLIVAVARMELALSEVADASADTYLYRRHEDWGKL